MERPCYKCGASVEEGTPFCRRCNAPQIRVVGPEPIPTAATTPEAAIEKYTAYAPPSHPSILEWPQALPSAGLSLIAAVFLISLGMPAGLGMFAAGFLSVVLYRRRCPATHVNAGLGARMGALTGAFGFALLAAILGLWTAFRSGKEIHDALLNYIQQYAARSSDAHMQQVLDLFNTPEGFTFIMILTLLMTLVAFTIFAGLGGAIGAFLLQRKERL
jgi:hypothetical protein